MLPGCIKTVFFSSGGVSGAAEFSGVLIGTKSLFERSEFLIATCGKKKTDLLCGCVCVCVDARLILVLVVGRQIVYGQKTVYLCLTRYIVFEKFLKTNTRTAQLRPANHPHIATAASDTEGVAAVSCMESHMNRGPLGSIDPNSIRETELHTECRRRRERESLNSPRRDRERDAARQRAAATRMREIDEERAERCVFHCLRCQQPYTLGAAAK